MIDNTVWVTCDFCYRSHGALVNREGGNSLALAVQSAYEKAGESARRCDHTGGVNR